MDSFVYLLFISFIYFIQLAGIALAQEMSLTGRSTHLLYYMAVQHYLLRRYDDALTHLKEARCQYGMVRHCFIVRTKFVSFTLLISSLLGLFDKLFDGTLLFPTRRSRRSPKVL